ncbi:valine--tRNA ligase [Candidatus Pacearchaeota archaeon]|nr:valine--tRNA ligase [Candidatus Pacearchaeota archaeon]
MPEINIKEIEEKWRKYWEKEKIYAFDKTKIKGKNKIYSIDTPPPTVSGEMHIGHAFSYSQQDFIVRYKRMNGSVFYPFGTDDNGLPTERLVEKINNVKSKNMSRKEFIELCLKTLKKITPEFIEDWKILGISADYNTYYSTIDKNSQKISQESFVELFNKKQIYKQEFPSIWCVECQTSIAQAELEDKEQNTLFSTIKFKADGKDLLIATTRPELLPACIAVFVNPKDKRYKNLVGKKAKVPVFNHEVPILEDSSADIEKGTGVLMICSYGDKFDVDAINRHKLNVKIILNQDGTLNEKAGILKGLRIKEARKKILEELEKHNLITEKKHISNNVNIHDKCGTEIEFIPTAQWFIKILDKKEQLIKQGKKIKWYPEYMFKRYENWVKGLEWDWNISRDRHFGIPIPAWQCEKCKNIIVADKEELPIDPLQVKKKCPKCKSEVNATPETKVLDTWATSSLTPQLASSLIDNKIIIPYSLRPQAHDIIRTWAFYTITKSYLHENKIPWEDIVISGFVTLQGEKMSKSKGNAIKPQEIIDKYGADAIRYWAASSKLGEDLEYQEKDVITGRKFVTKILNATNFVFMNLNYQEKMPKLHETDRLFLIQLNKAISQATQAFDNYNYSQAKQIVDSFFWQIFSDNYLEIVKNRVYNGTKEEKASAFYALYNSLLAIVKMMAPITPYITEEIYQNHFKKHEKINSIHLTKWPDELKLPGIKERKEDDKQWNKLLEIITKVRQEKSLAKKSVKADIILHISGEDNKLLKNLIQDLKTVTASKDIKEGSFRVEFL